MEDTIHKLGIDLPKLIAQTINFGIVLFVLWKWAYRPVLKMLEVRREQIAESLTNAEKIKEELAKTEAARREVLDKANTAANQLIEEARSAAVRLQEQETQKAIAQAEQIIAKARDAALADHARMLAELKREIGQLVVQTTGRVAGKVLTTEDQRRLIEETNKQLAA